MPSLARPRPTRLPARCTTMPSPTPSWMLAASCFARLPLGVSDTEVATVQVPPQAVRHQKMNRAPREEQDPLEAKSDTLLAPPLHAHLLLRMRIFSLNWTFQHLLLSCPPMFLSNTLRLLRLPLWISSSNLLFCSSSTSNSNSSSHNSRLQLSSNLILEAVRGFLQTLKDPRHYRLPLAVVSTARTRLQPSSRSSQRIPLF